MMGICIVYYTAMVNAYIYVFTTNTVLALSILVVKIDTFIGISVV
jgi:hypothetical protein